MPPSRPDPHDWEFDVWVAKQAVEFLDHQNSLDNIVGLPKPEDIDWDRLADFAAVSGDAPDWAVVIRASLFRQLPTPERFSFAVPPTNKIYSHRRRPCRLEQRSQPAQSGWDAEANDCPFTTMCEQSAHALQKLESRVFGRIKVTLAEPSSTIAMRPEHQYHRHESKRHTLRKHFHELMLLGDRQNTEHPWAPLSVSETELKELESELTKYFSRHAQTIRGLLSELRRLKATHRTARSFLGAMDRWLDNNGVGLDNKKELTRIITDCTLSAMGCRPFRHDEKLGEYLGFVDTRPNYESAPLAMGLLAVPSKYRHDADVHILTGQYGRFFGGEAFPCTVYSMHDGATSGAHCAQACLIMALGMLADRKARIRGTYELTYLASPNKLALDPKRRCECEAQLDEGEQPNNTFEVRGLTVGQMSQLANDSKASAAVLKNRHTRETTRLIGKIVKAYVARRFPLIMQVATSKWWSWMPNAKTCHAVTIVGYRETSEGMNLIVHDPGYIPYHEVSLPDCLEAARTKHYPKNENEEDSARAEKIAQSDDVYLVALADYSVKVHAHECVSALDRASDDFERYARGERGYDYHVLLLDRDAITESLCIESGLKSRLRDVQREITEKLPCGRYWAIIGTHAKKPQMAWLFAAGRANLAGGRPWSARVAIHVGEPSGQVQDLLPLPSAVPDTTPFPQKKEGTKQLRPGVMTSSSIRELGDLFSEVAAVSDVHEFDLMILRDTDIEAMERSSGQSLAPLDPAEPLTAANLVGNPENFDIVVDWLLKQCVQPHEGQRKTRISALATFFPDITSLHAARREIAIEAITQSVRIALRLQQEGVMEHAIVEIVCGGLLDPCLCNHRDCCDDATGVVFASSPATKRRILLRSLRKVIGRLQDPGPFALALELEPGSTYVLKDHSSIISLGNQIRGDEVLRARVGFNLDVAHMKIAEISAKSLQPISDMFVHAHIADHPPWMHCRDQVVGEWTTVDRHDGAYIPYLRLLANRTIQGNDDGLPFSGVIALELEGCNRMSWVHRSLSAMKQLMHMVNNYG